MSSAQKDYWTECVEIAFCDAGIAATPEQIEIVAGAVEGGHENYGMAFYQPPSGEHTESEVARLKRELSEERRKVVCGECKGVGRVTEQGPYHSYNSECSKCRGEGRVL